MKKRIRILTLALAFSLMTSQAAQAALISPLSVGQTGGPGVTENQQSSNGQTGGQTGNASPDFRGTSRLPWKGRDITAGHLPSREPPGSRTASRRQEREPELRPGRLSERGPEFRPEPAFRNAGMSAGGGTQPRNGNRDADGGCPEAGNLRGGRSPIRRDAQCLFV